MSFVINTESDTCQTPKLLPRSLTHNSLLQSRMRALLMQYREHKLQLGSAAECMWGDRDILGQAACTLTFHPPTWPLDRLRPWLVVAHAVWKKGCCIVLTCRVVGAKHVTVVIFVVDLLCVALCCSVLPRGGGCDVLFSFDTEGFRRHVQA